MITFGVKEPEVGYGGTHDDQAILVGGDQMGNGARTRTQDPRAVAPWRRCLQQPPWWAWVLVVIWIGVLGLLVIHMVVSSHLTSQVDTQGTEKVTGLKDCKDVYDSGQHASGVYTVSPDGDLLIDVYCEQQLDGGSWVVFQVRYNGSVDFSRDWYTYKMGFGDLMGEFWLGNQNIHKLTKQHDQQLKVELVHPNGDLRYADYSHFWVADETSQYLLQVGGYTGGTPPGDSLAHQSGSSFHTWDHQNDAQSSHCPHQQVGGWWYRGCNYANLNAYYYSDTHDHFHQNGSFWYTWKPPRSMVASRMMFRRRP